MLLKAHEQISTLNHIPTVDEQILQGKFTSVGKSLEEFSPALKGMAKAMYSLNQTSPVAAVKAATHHMLLGTFSMAQFPVQALGATIAMSINPTYAAKGMGKWLALSYLDNIKDPAIKAAQLKKLSKVKGLGLEDIEDTYRLWNRSGYRDSVLITNGDYASIANGLPYDGNVVKRLFDKGTFFFKAGEMANMRISFATSLERWKDLNKGKKLDDKALKEIFARSEQFRLNMGQGNRARFQKGVISIPLQFQQINTKFLEAVTPGSVFTGREKVNLAVGQGVLFGSIGIPFGQQITSWLLDTTDIDTSNMSAEQLNLLKRGITGWVLNNQLDVDAELSGRVAVAGGVSDAIIDAIFEKHSILGVLGPAGSVGERFWNGPLDILMNANKLRVSADKLDTNQIGLIAENLLWSLGEIPSSTRNAIIAWDLWKSGMVRGSNGQVMWISDPGLEDVVFQAMGFQSVNRQEFWELIKSGKAQQEAEKALLDRLSRTYMRLNRSLESKDYEGANNAAYTVAVLANYLDEPAQQSKLTKQLINRFKADEEDTKIVEKLMKNSSDFTSSSGLRLNLLHQEAIAPREE